MRIRTTCRTQGGLTLVELMVGVALLAAVLQLALPSLAAMLTSAAVRTAAEQLLADLHLARAAAASRNVRVALCRSVDGATCGGASGWQDGWLVFEDANNDGVREQGEPLIARRAALGSGLRIQANQPLQDYISYDGFGFARRTNGAFQAGTLTVCRQSDEAAETREVILNALGRPRMQRGTAPAC